MYKCIVYLRIRLKIASVDALNQLLGHLDDFLSARCNNRQWIMNQFAETLGMPVRRMSYGYIFTAQTQSHARILYQSFFLFFFLTFFNSLNAHDCALQR